MPSECGSCGRQLSDEFDGIPRKPCPDCGETKRTFSVSSSSELRLMSAIDTSVVHGHTGREVRNAEPEQRAIEWASLEDRDAILNHPAANMFRGFLDSAPHLLDDWLVLFRGRGIREGEQIPPTVEQMGPRPLGMNQGEGRYHRKGQRVLYLADSEDGVRREIEAWHTEGTPYLIRIEVPLSSLRIVDFANWPIDHFMTAVFSRAETCKVGQRGPSNYVFSQAVGELVAEKVDGMRIPGVRGTPGAHYKNVVLFRRLEEWTKWTSPAHSPYLLSTKVSPDSLSLSSARMNTATSP
jgi:hypothetical protein